MLDVTFVKRYKENRERDKYFYGLIYGHIYTQVDRQIHRKRKIQTYWGTKVNSGSDNFQPNTSTGGGERNGHWI